jgi:hypothetical protein
MRRELMFLARIRRHGFVRLPKLPPKSKLKVYGSYFCTLVIRKFSRKVFFRDVNAPGYLLNEEHLAATLPAGRTTQAEIREESARAHRILQRILPEPRLPDQ